MAKLTKKEQRMSFYFVIMMSSMGLMSLIERIYPGNKPALVMAHIAFIGTMMVFVYKYRKTKYKILWD